MAEAAVQHWTMVNVLGLGLVHVVLAMSVPIALLVAAGRRNLL